MIFDRPALFVQQATLLVVIVLLPFSNAAIEIGFAVLLVGWMARHVPLRWRQSIWANRNQRLLLKALVAFVMACLASVIVSTFPAHSVRGLITKWLQYLLLMVVVADIVQGDSRVVHRVLQAFAWSAFFVVVEAVGQELFGRGPFRGITLYNLWNYGRMRGPYTNPIDLGTYFMMVILLLLATFSRWKPAGRWVIGVLIVAMLGCLVRTQAVGAWIGLGAGLLVMAVVSRQMRWPAVLVVAFLAVAGAIYLTAHGILADTFLLRRPGTTDRWYMWQAALRMIAERPWCGHGLNTFMANYLTYWVGGEQQPRYAHNCYLQMAAETGLIGLAAFLSVLWYLLVRIWQGLRMLNGHDRAALLALLASLGAFLIQSAIDTNFYVVRQVALFWILAGLAVGLSQHALACQHASVPK